MEAIFTLLMLILLQAVLGFDNLLYISLESKRAPEDQQRRVRAIGIGLAIILRIVLLVVLLKVIHLFKDPIFPPIHTSFIEGSFNIHSLIVLLGGAFIIYTAVKEIFHMLILEEAHAVAEKPKASVKTVITWIVIMNLVFSFDSILSAMALTDTVWVMATAIVISGVMMIWLSDHVAQFLQKNRMYEVLGLFVLFIVGIMLLSEGGHLAHLKFFGHAVMPMTKATFYFVLVVLVLVDVVQGRYQRKLACRTRRQSLPFPNLTIMKIACLSPFFASALAAFSPFAGTALAADTAPRPNVVLIFIDDMGYGDVGFNGATVPKTPNLDQMAAEGMKFTDFYVGCAVCSGSRTALLTGCHYQRLSMAAVLFPNSKQGLHPDEVTLADMLGATGYRTACVGKWHLGHLPPCLPTYQGFDFYWGIPYSNDMWIDPANKLADDIVLRDGLTLEQVKAGHKGKNVVPILRDEEVVEYPADQTTITKRYTEHAIQFIREKSEKPFFLYLPHTMVHLPLAVSEAFADPDKALITNAIEEVDWSVGEILKTLRETGLAEKTLVIFTSDNGAAVGSSLPLRAKKGSVYDGGIREPTLMWWPGKIPAGAICSEVAASIDVLPTLAGLCGGALPERKIDGKDIWPLMSGADGAKSPHENYVLMHGPGTVRSGKWKFYPWPEGKGKQRGGQPKGPPSPDPEQLYDTVADIGETKNLAAQHPEVIVRLQAAYDAHIAEIKSNRRPTAPLVRPEGAISPERPGGARKKRKG